MIELFQAVTRPVVTLMLIGTLCYGFLAGTVSADGFLPIVGAVAAFWFAQRQAQKEQQKPPAEPPSPSAP